MLDGMFPRGHTELRHHLGDVALASFLLGDSSAYPVVILRADPVVPSLGRLGRDRAIQRLVSLCAAPGRKLLRIITEVLHHLFDITSQGFGCQITATLEYPVPVALHAREIGSQALNVAAPRHPAGRMISKHVARDSV